MDDDTAEIELLEQNLNKTHQISQRMTSILQNFDTRLVKLEKSILPLYNSTQILTRRANNIEKALLKIDEIASNQEGIAAEEALILRGPQPGQLSTYKEAVARLNASIVLNSSDRDAGETASLVETGAKKLAQLYTKLVAEGSSGSPPYTGGPDFVPTPFPQDLFDSLSPLVAFLRTLPLPATHPSHPAAPSISSNLKEAQRGYADMRGRWCKQGLEIYGKRVVDRAETLDGVAAGREFGKWIAGLLSVAEMEYDLLQELAPLPNQISETYAMLLIPLMSLFTSTLTSLTALIKSSLHKYTFLALSSYAELSLNNERWDRMLSWRSPGNSRARETNELKDGLHGLRAICLRSFPEFLADIKLAASVAKGEETDTSVAECSITTVQYMGRLLEVREAVGPALLTLGDGNWKMGDGIQVGRGKLGEGDEQLIIEHYIYDVINAIITTLTTLSRTTKWPAFGAMFLLNNVAYLRLSILREPVISLLSRPTQDALNSAFRTAKAGYFDANFSPLMQALADDPNSKASGKAATKEKFTRFFDLLEEVVERHRIAKVLEEDPENRAKLAEETVKLVVPSLQKFTQKNREKEFSKNPQKYIKMSTEEVEVQIRGLFR